MNTRQRIGAGAAAVVLAASAFALGGHASYNGSSHRLSMAAGSTVQVNCNGSALHFTQLQQTIGGVTCDPTIATTTTTVNPGSSTTVTPPTTVVPPSDCPLTIAGKQCWEARTGVPGWTEAQIVAGLSPLTHTVGNRDVTADGTVIDGQWIDGCIAIKASNVVIRNSLIRTSNPCFGGDGQSLAAAINTGNGQGAGTVKNLTVVDSEVDAGQTDDGYDYTAIGASNYTLLRVNVHGTTHVIAMGNGTTVRDSFIHDPSNATVNRHNEAIFMDTGAHNVLDHSWVSAWNGNTTSGSTGAVFNGGSWGPPHDNTITNNFLEGGRGADLVVATLATNTVVTGNRLSPNTAYGNTFTYDYQPNGGNVWSDNLNSETGAVVGP